MSKNLISIENLQKSFSGKVICENESFGIFDNKKIGFIGINGCGKSTLLKMLFHIEEPDFGRIIYRKGIRVGYLDQVPQLNPELSIYEHIYFSDHPEFTLLREYHRILEKIVLSPDSTSQSELQKIIRKMDAKNAWKTEIKARSFLTKFGFSNFDEKIKTLSGGQKRRLDLARVLMDNPDVLLLDEPTNHLDIDIIEWLQDYLSNYKGTVIFVTHDRYFLDAVSDKIMEIENGKIKFYQGNYSNFIRRKEQELIDLQRKKTRRSAQLKKELKWLQRGAKARTSKPKNHLDRVKELIDKSYLSNDAELDISFMIKRLGKTILEIQNVGKEYGNLELFKNFNHTFQKMERIGIIGANGCGKTTLLKLIINEEKPSSGKIKTGVNTKISYFKQDIDEFNKDQSVMNYIREYADNIRTADSTLHSASEMLKKFLFDGKMQQNKIKSLSGGEQKRLYLLRSLMFGSNFIILDEPTNDLDIKTLEILEDYLDAFKGNILVVSHDRFFLDRVVDYLFIFEEDKIIKFPGNYSDYLLVKRYREEIKQEKEKAKKERIKSKRDKLTFKEKRELQFLETEISKLELKQKHIEQKIENEAANLNYKDFTTITAELKEIEKKHTKLSNRWLALEERN